ncbi:hypothetical protein HOP50_01g05650 [Chloropicon primus]|uniref:Uncharacterized protein n=1 Tax=Chloropicon primus TaxID=1764295 RepID=A0A5B8MFG7_9CHLO|nr:hypothetical protein A3770_01p05780 [Chloropicon primus]UPQ97274.1 hypothetical protein HOP50_01g05650 [Chloropicon primus]|eukprot:QDZ18060.1 hypothetical protein A3770_01p05780 [Chloropicon primus]
MESERRSTMSSLKGQLSNVEGSVKSMKATVVAGSVLTVACLAAVFGVTILANEVSKEVKVSNGTLTAKNGEAVLTTNSFFTDKANSNTESVVLNSKNGATSGVFAVNAVVTEGTKVTMICDDLVVVSENGANQVSVAEDSILNSLMQDEVEKRSTNLPFYHPFWWALGKFKQYLWNNREEIIEHGKTTEATISMCGVWCHSQKK